MHLVLYSQQSNAVCVGTKSEAQGAEAWETAPEDQWGATV